MKVTILDFGDQIILEKDWELLLIPEHKNGEFASSLEVSISVTLPKGTILKVDRVYIRKSNEDYSYVSFYCKQPTYSKFFRFFASLKDVNKIEFSYL